jgi:hypothetical protein
MRTLHDPFTPALPAPTRAVARQEVETPPARVLADTEASWRPLYRLGGIAALFALALIPLSAAIYFLWPPPSTVAGHLTLLHERPLLGLLSLDLPMLLSTVALLPIYLALYAALRHANPSFMALALVLGLVNLTTYVTTNPAFGLLTLSEPYATATTDAQRQTILGAGQAIYAISVGTAFDVGYVLAGVAALVIGIVMLRGGGAIFGRATAYAGLTMGAFSLVPATAGTVGLVSAFVSLLPTMAWLALVGRDLWRLGGRSR